MGALDSLIYWVFHCDLPIHYYFHFLYWHFFSWLQSYVNSDGHRTYDTPIIIKRLHHMHPAQENELWKHGVTQVQIICLRVLCASYPDWLACIHFLDQVSLRWKTWTLLHWLLLISIISRFCSLSLCELHNVLEDQSLLQAAKER